jgi:arylsulfatase A-like enzyme
MSEEYIEQIGIADQAIGILLEKLEKANLLDHYFILVQSDHGGHGKSHGTDLPEDLTIPWIAAGPKIKQLGEIEGPVRIFDTAPTLAHVLDLPMSEEWEGQPILQIF